jgi:hypothetical protein
MTNDEKELAAQMMAHVSGGMGKTVDRLLSAIERLADAKAAKLKAETAILENRK